MPTMPGMHIPHAEALGERLRKAREDAGYRQEDAAKAIGKTVSTQTWLSQIERGRNDIATADLRALADLYRVSVSWLVGQEPLEGPVDLLKMLGDVSGQLMSIPVHDLEGRDGFATGEIHRFTYTDPPPTAASKSLVEVRVRGDLLPPDVLDGYRIVVDRDRSAQVGDLVVISDREEVHICRYERRKGIETYICKDGECSLSGTKLEGVIIQIGRDL